MRQYLLLTAVSQPKWSRKEKKMKKFILNEFIFPGLILMLLFGAFHISAQTTASTVISSDGESEHSAGIVGLRNVKFPAYRTGR